MKKMLVILASLGVLLASVSPAPAAEEKVLNIYNWSEYLPDSIIKQFTKETGIKINYSTFDSNEALYAKLKTLKGKGYDIVVPSTYYVSRMRREGMLLPLDKSKLPNFTNLDPKLLNQPHDPESGYSVPYLWGTTGLIVNNKLVKPVGSVSKWADLWDPKFKSSILLLDDVRDVFSIGLKVLGYPINDTNEDHIREAYLKLKEILPNVKAFNSETAKSLFIGEEVALGMSWNGEVWKARLENPNLSYIYPQEGAMIWMDSMVIPVAARHPENAHMFINFIMRPQIAATIVDKLGYATPNIEAFKLLPKEMQQNRTIYPTEEDLKNSEIQQDVVEAVAIYQKYWEMLKVGR